GASDLESSAAEIKSGGTLHPQAFAATRGDNEGHSRVDCAGDAHDGVDKLQVVEGESAAPVLDDIDVVIRTQVTVERQGAAIGNNTRIRRDLTPDEIVTQVKFSPVRIQHQSAGRDREHSRQIAISSRQRHGVAGADVNRHVPRYARSDALAVAPFG